MRIKLDIQRFAEYGKVIIPVEVDTKSVDKDLNTLEKKLDNVSKPKEVNIDINSKIEAELKKLYSKYEKGTFKKQYVPEDSLEDPAETVKKIKKAYDEMAEQYADFDSVIKAIPSLQEYSKLTKENKDEIALINKMMEEQTLQINMARNNMDMYEAKVKDTLNANKENTAELEKQTELTKELATNSNLVYKSKMKSTSTVDSSAISSALSNKGGESGGDSSEAMGSKAMMIANIFGKITEFGKGLLKTVGKVLWTVVKIAGAIAGITLGASLLATLGTALVKAIVKILEENQQLIANIKYIVFLVTKMIDNIAQAITGKVGGALQGIVNIVYTIVVLFGRLLSWLFKIDVFAGTSAEEFKEWEENTRKASNNLGGATKSAKDLKKQLAGFDEMNVLQEPTTGGGGGGGVGSNLPLPNLKDMSKIKTPKWLQWILDNGDIIFGIIMMIAGAITFLKLGLDPLMGLGIGSILAGVINLIIDIVAFLKDPTWENFKTLIDDFLIDLALIIGGIAVLTGNWIPGVIAIVMLLAGLIIRYWNEIKEMFSKAWGWIKEKVIDPIANAFKGLWDGIKQVFAPFINFFSELFGTLWENIKIMINNIKIIVNWIAGIIKEVFSAVWNRIKEIFSPVVEWFKEKWEQALAVIKKVFGPIVEWISGIWEKIKSKLKEWGAKIAEVIGGAFKSVINGIIGAIESILNKPINAINGLIDKIKGLPGLGGLTKLKTFKFTRLASGAIINQPGRGVAIGGEAGREGILPLTDSKAMRQLGEEIGKWISITVPITNTMNGRVISRELKIIDNESRFAGNV